MFNKIAWPCRSIYKIKVEKIIVTSALPYANGPLHFGHIAGVHLPADIFTRHKRIMGQTVIHVSGADEHGVAIMLSAEKEGISYSAYVDHWYKKHQELLNKYGVAPDYFGRTSASYHKEEVQKWFNKLYDNGFIDSHPEKQLFCEDCKRYLPDRYVEGGCYICSYPNARGDECPECGEWIEPLRLKEPQCKICGSKKIIIKESVHWYLLLTKLSEKFRSWFDTKRDWRPHVWGYVNSLAEQGFVDRAISRDLSWGIDVPLPDAIGKKLYVWFDAPIGYVSITKELLKVMGSKDHYLEDWWSNPKTKIYHFIGKDNVVFHGLIWPAMIMGSNFINLPFDVPASHFVKLENKQFSKSAGWYVDSEKAYEAFGQDALRFYLCSIIPETGDSNFSWDNFLAINNELANKVGNFINRSLSFLAKHWPDGLPHSAFQKAFDTPEFLAIAPLVADIRNSIDEIQITKALSGLLRLGEVANETFHRLEPWHLIKSDRDDAAKVIALSLMHVLAIGSVFRPFLPNFATNLAKYFEPDLNTSILDGIYRGNIDIMKSFFHNGYRLTVIPSPLIPRIDPVTVDPFRLAVIK